MGLWLAPSALANACILAALAGSLTLTAVTYAQPAQPAAEAPAAATSAPVTPAPAPARAAQPSAEDRGPIALHWVRLPGTEHCIAGDALARRVESKLRRNVFPAARDATILIEGHVRKTDSGYAAELHMRDQSGKALGSRELSSEDESCTELSDTLGVVLAVMIDPDAARRAPSAPEPEKEQPKAESERAGGDENRVLAFGRAVFGITKQPLLGFGTAYERALGVAGGLRIEVALFADSKTPVSYPDVDVEAQAVVRVTYAGIAYCPLWLDFTRTRLSACAGLELGGASGHGNRFPKLKGNRQGVWASASASVRLAIAIVSGLEAHLAGGLVGAFGHPFVVENEANKQVRILPSNRAHLAGQLDLGLGARF